MVFSPSRSNERRQTWCGPYALALLGGVEYDVAYDKIKRGLNRWQAKLHKERHRFGKPYRFTRVQGMSNSEVTAVGHLFGQRIKWQLAPKLTLASWVDMHTVKGRAYLVNITRHYVVVKDGLYCDNQSRGWLPVEGSKWARRFMVCYSEAKLKA